MDDTFFKKQKEASDLQVPVLARDFNHPDICWNINTCFNMYFSCLLLDSCNKRCSAGHVTYKQRRTDMGHESWREPWLHWPSDQDPKRRKQGKNQDNSLGFGEPNNFHCYAGNRPYLSIQSVCFIHYCFVHHSTITARNSARIKPTCISEIEHCLFQFYIERPK